MTSTGFSVRSDVRHKPPKGDPIYKTFHRDWDWVKGGAKRLCKAVTQGVAVTPGCWSEGTNRYGFTVQGYKSKYRGNFKEAHFVMLDFDGGLTLDDAITHPFFSETASFLYTSPSHRLPGKGDRLRVVWQLSTPVNSWKDLDDVILSLRLKLGKIDDTAINAASLLFGSQPDKNDNFFCHIWKGHQNRLDPAPLIHERQQAREKRRAELIANGYAAGQNWELDKETCGEDRVALMVHCLKFHKEFGARYVPERIEDSGSYDIVFMVLGGLIHYFGVELTYQIIEEAEYWGDESFDIDSLIDELILREEDFDPELTESWSSYNTILKLAGEHLVSIDSNGVRGQAWVCPAMPKEDFLKFKFDQQEEPPISPEEVVQAFAELEEPSPDDMLSYYNPVVAEQIKGKCENILANPEMAAMAFLSAIASVVGRKMRCHIIHGYHQESIIWTMSASKTSSGKDAAANAGAGFLSEIQRLTDLEHERKYRDAKPHEIPRRKIFKATDGQIQGTVANLETDGSLFRFQDECIGFFEGFDQFNGGKGNEEQKWLKLWAGADVVELLRNEKDSYNIKQPRVSISGLTQLEPLLKILRKATNNGQTGGNGMFGRWLFNLPTMPKKRYLNPHTFYYGNQQSSQWDETALWIGKQLYFTKEETLWRPSYETAEWYRKWLNKLFEKTEKESGFVRDYIQKERAQIGRITLVFAAIDLALEEPGLQHNEGFRERELKLSTLQRACGLFEYHVNQVRVLVSLMQRGGSTDSVDISTRLQAKIESDYAANDIIDWRGLSSTAPLRQLLRKREIDREQVEDLLRSFACVKEEDGKFIRI